MHSKFYRQFLMSPNAKNNFFFVSVLLEPVTPVNDDFKKDFKNEFGKDFNRDFTRFLKKNIFTIILMTVLKKKRF